MSVKYAFCEAVTASSLSRKHIRKLTYNGLKLGGGIDTPSLCGRVNPPYGWDITYVTPYCVEHVCKTCHQEYQRVGDE